MDYVEKGREVAKICLPNELGREGTGQEIRFCI